MSHGELGAHVIGAFVVGRQVATERGRFGVGPEIGAAGESPEQGADRRLMRVDQVYTVLNKLGVIPLAVFVVAYPITNEIEHQVRAWGFAPPRVENYVPWLKTHALASFLGLVPTFVGIGRRTGRQQ